MISDNLLYPLLYGFAGGYAVFLFSIAFTTSFKEIVKFIQSDEVIYSVFAFFIFTSIVYFFMVLPDRTTITSTEAVLFSGILAMFFLLREKKDKP